METQEEIKILLTAYLHNNPGEANALQLFSDFVHRYKGKQLFDRKNFDGHITASAFIVDTNFTALLLLKHTFLNRWLQPGGHVDDTDTSLIHAALREAEEETGISAADLLPVSNAPFDFNSHSIPENKRKQELPHHHHDARFLFVSSKVDTVNIAVDESTDSKWIALSSLADDEEFGKVVKKIMLARNRNF